MPRYLNTSNKAEVLGVYGLVDAGKTVTTREYVELAEDSPFELIDGTSPWDVLHAGPLPVNITSGLAKYHTLEVINTSGAVASMVANGDSAKPRIIPDQNNRFLSFPKVLDALSITGSGSSGYVYVYGDLEG